MNCKGTIQLVTTTKLYNIFQLILSFQCRIKSTVILILSDPNVFLGFYANSPTQKMCRKSELFLQGIFSPNPTMISTGLVLIQYQFSTYIYSYSSIKIFTLGLLLLHTLYQYRFSTGLVPEPTVLSLYYIVRKSELFMQSRIYSYTSYSQSNFIGRYSYF